MRTSSTNAAQKRIRSLHCGRSGLAEQYYDEEGDEQEGDDEVHASHVPTASRAVHSCVRWWQGVADGEPLAGSSSSLGGVGKSPSLGSMSRSVRFGEGEKGDAARSLTTAAALPRGRSRLVSMSSSTRPQFVRDIGSTVRSRKWAVAACVIIIITMTVLALIVQPAATQTWIYPVPNQLSAFAACLPLLPVRSAGPPGSGARYRPVSDCLPGFILRCGFAVESWAFPNAICPDGFPTQLQFVLVTEVLTCTRPGLYWQVPSHHPHRALLCLPSSIPSHAINWMAGLLHDCTRVDRTRAHGC